VAAVIVGEPDGQAFDEQELRKALSRELSAYKVPRRIVALHADQVPLLSSGKVDLRALRRVFDA